MANINTSTIENFDSMTAEEKVKALLEVEIPEEVDLSQYVSKELFDKSASDRAALSKQLKEKETALKSKTSEQMTETEKLQEQIRELQESSEEALKAVREENEALKRKDTLRDYQTNFGLLGLDEKLSGETAAALADGDSAKVFANLKKFLETYKKSIEAELMRNTPHPDGSGRCEDGKESIAITKVKQLFGEQSGTSKNYETVLGNYLKK